MTYLTEWITNIILFILLAIVIDLLIPNSSLHRYVKMVVGLLLIVIILTPVLKLFSVDVDTILAKVDFTPSNEEENIENLIKMKKKEIQASQRAYILEQMAVQMESQVEGEMIKKYGYSIENVSVSLQNTDTDQISQEDLGEIKILMKRMDSKKQSSIAVVEKVQIDTTEPIKPKDELNHLEKIKRHLAGRWKVPEGKISIVVEGGMM